MFFGVERMACEWQALLQESYIANVVACLTLSCIGLFDSAQNLCALFAHVQQMCWLLIVIDKSGQQNLPIVRRLHQNFYV